MRLYQSVFSREALRFAVVAPDDAFGEINHWVDRIERMPSTPGDYTEQDADGRELQTTVLNQVAITHWLGHATREVRVIRIEAKQPSFPWP
jgi:hypothetical protein